MALKIYGFAKEKILLIFGTINFNEYKRGK